MQVILRNSGWNSLLETAAGQTVQVEVVFRFRG